MKKMMRCLAALLLIVMALSMPGGSARAEGGFSGTITLIDFCQPGDGELESAPALCFETLIDLWREAHPEIRLVEKKRTSGEIASLARIGHLPDVFMVDAKSGRTYGKNGMIAELTDAIMASEYMERYDTMMLAPFLYYGRLAAFPMLAKSDALVIYDARAWERAGLEGFPKDRDEAGAQAGAFLGLGYHGLIAMAPQDGYAALRSVVGPLLRQGDGMDWLQHMIDGDQTCLFGDEVFIDALADAEKLLAGDGFAFGGELTDQARALEAFLAGEYPALVARGGEIYRALDTIKEKSPELYESLGFAALPTAAGGGESYVPTGVDYGLFISADAAKDPERFAACVSLCEFLTGAEYADMMAALYGRRWFTEASDAAWEAFFNDCDDETLTRLARFTREDMKTCLDITLYLHYSAWSDCAGGLMARLTQADGEDSALTYGEIANNAQDDYEKYYLGIKAEM